MTFREKLDKGEFVVTAELCPPKGPDISSFIRKAGILKEAVDIVNITDNQRAVMRMCSLAGACIALKQGLEPVLQVTCRDRNRIAVQSDLLGAYAMGIYSLLLLTGDYVTEGDHPEAKPVFDLDSCLLIKTAAGLNRGIPLSGRNMNAKTDFFIGAAVNPCADPFEPHRISFEKKIEAGASFFQTQAVFDMERFAEFMEYAGRFNVKILAGVLLVKSVKMAVFLNDNVPGVYVPHKMIDRLRQSDEPLRTGVEMAGEQIRELKRNRLCDGVHIMTVGNEELVKDILKGV